MRYIVVIITALTFLANPLTSEAQGWKDKLKKGFEEVTGSDAASGLTEGEVGDGLKEALLKGIKVGVDQLSATDGYFKDELIKIMMPEEAEKVESTLRRIGLGNQVDDVILSMNRAAEDAASGALDIFVGAIKEMTFEDAMALLRGGDDAATQYLQKKTTDDLTEKFKPVIKTSLDKVNATKYWNTVMNSYNKVPFVKPMEADLDVYVTEKAIDGLFVQVAKQEKEIRENPGARTTDLLKKVFAD